MGYFWEQLERKWVPRPRYDRTHTEQGQVTRRKNLLLELIDELTDDSKHPVRRLAGEDAEYYAYTQLHERAVKLYAGLLARTLIGTDEMLMKKFGEEIAELTAGGEKVSK